MNLNSKNLADLISLANSNSTNGAQKMFEANISCGKIRPVSAIFAKLFSSFLKNQNKFSFKDRLIYSVLASFTDFLKYLKLLKLRKVF